MAVNDYALVVGITRYPALGNLDGPENDARDFRKWLLHPRGGNVPDANISLVVSSAFPASPTSLLAKPQIVEIENVLDSYFLIGSNSTDGTAGRRLYLYFAGHGFAPDLEDAALFMANAAKGMTGYHVTGRPYANWFRKARYFEEVILFMDCCRDLYKRAQPRLPPYEDITATTPGERYFAFATKWSRKAREGPFGSNGSTRGIFTLALLDALRGGANPDANGQVTGKDLEQYVINAVQAKAKETGLTLDDPEFDFNHNVRILFNTPPTEAPVNTPEFTADEEAPQPARYIVIAQAPDGLTFTLTRGDKIPIAESSRDNGRWTWLIADAGLYIVTRSDGAKLNLELIGKGRTVDVQFQ